MIKHCSSTIEFCLFHTSLLLAKAVLVPIEVLALTAVGSCAKVSRLFSKVDHISHHLTALTDDIQQMITITVKYGLFPKGEELQKINGRHDGPQFVRIQPETQRVNTLILYAPGYIDTPDTLRDTCRKIANDFGAPVYIARYRNLFQSIDEHANDLKDIAEVVKKETQASSLILMGHSMGGLVTGKYLEGEQPMPTLLWVTIGAPLRGTRLAQWGLGACAKQMRPNSEWMRQFALSQQTIKTNSLHIYSKTDHVVQYKSSRRKSGSAQNFVCKKAVSHLGIRSDETVLEYIKTVAYDALKKSAN